MMSSTETKSTVVSVCSESKEDVEKKTISYPTLCNIFSELSFSKNITGRITSLLINAMKKGNVALFESVFDEINRLQKIYNNDTDSIISSILGSSVNFDLTNHEITIEVCDHGDERKYFGSLLHFACNRNFNPVEEKQLEIVKILIKNGFNPDATFTLAKQTPLQVACIHGMFDIIAYILKNTSADISKFTRYTILERYDKKFTKQNCYGFPIYSTSSNLVKPFKFNELFSLVCMYGDGILFQKYDKADEKHAIPLATELVILFIERGVDVNDFIVKENKLTTPLLLCFNDDSVNLDMFNLLVRFGADPIRQYWSIYNPVSRGVLYPKPIPEKYLKELFNVNP